MHGSWEVSPTNIIFSLQKQKPLGKINIRENFPHTNQGNLLPADQALTFTWTRNNWLMISPTERNGKHFEWCEKSSFLLWLFVGQPSVSVRAKVAKSLQCPSVRSRREVAGKRHLPGHCHWVCGSRTSAESEQEKPRSLHSASTLWIPTVHQPLFRRGHRMVGTLHSWAALCKMVLVLLPADPHLFPRTGQSQCPCSQQEQTCVTGSTSGKEDVMQANIKKVLQEPSRLRPVRHQPMFIFFLHTL